MVELKPCPFCGGLDGRNGNYFITEVSVQYTEHGFRGIVECGCGASMVSYLFDDETDAYENAIEEWNRRVDNG